MYRNYRFRNFVRFAVVLGFAVTSVVPSAWAQNAQTQGQGMPYPPGQYPPGQRPQPIALQCQSALADRVSADAGRRVSLGLDTQDSYSAANGRQGLRGRLRYGIAPLNSWRTATYDCVVNPRQNRVERATYAPRANSGGWPGGARDSGRSGWSGSGQLSQGSSGHIGARQFQHQVFRERQNHPWMGGHHRAPFSHTERQRELPGYVLWSGRAH